METNLNLPELIQRTRKQQGLSREALAGLAKVSTTFIRDAERDSSNCSFGKLQQLCGALGLKWQMLQGDRLVWSTNTFDALAKQLAETALNQTQTGANP